MLPNPFFKHTSSLQKHDDCGSLISVSKALSANLKKYPSTPSTVPTTCENCQSKGFQNLKKYTLKIKFLMNYR